MWNRTQLTMFEKVLDEFQQYDNTAGVFVGNEVITMGEHGSLRTRLYLLTVTFSKRLGLLAIHQGCRKRRQGVPELQEIPQHSCRILCWCVFYTCGDLPC